MKSYLVKRAGEILKCIDVYGSQSANISSNRVMQFYAERTGLSVEALIKLGVGVEEVEGNVEATEWSEHEDTESENSSCLN